MILFFFFSLKGKSLEKWLTYLKHFEFQVGYLNNITVGQVQWLLRLKEVNDYLGATTIEFLIQTLASSILVLRGQVF